MTRREKPRAGNARRRGSTEATRSDGGGNPLSQTTASADAEAARVLVYPNPDARPRVQRIALVTMSRLDREALCYALNACQRMDARLDILTNLPPEETDRAVIAARGAADTPWRVFRVGGESGDDIRRYARNESGLLFLASGAGDETARKLRDKSASDGIRLGVPWVEVEGKQGHR